MAEMQTSISLRINDQDLGDFEVFVDRLAQGLRHMKWATGEYRKAMASRPASDAAPIPKEDLTL